MSHSILCPRNQQEQLPAWSPKPWPGQAGVLHSLGQNISSPTSHPALTVAERSEAGDPAAVELRELRACQLCCQSQAQLQEVHQLLTVELSGCSLPEAPWCRFDCTGQVHPSIQPWVPDYS